MVDSLEQRVKDVEDLIADIPHLVGLRLESITASQQETSARLGLIDKQMSMMLRDVRDMRGGVTRQLIEQDKRLAAIEGRLEALEGRFEAREAGLDQRLKALDTRQAAYEKKNDKRFDTLEAKIGERFGSLEAKIDLVLARLPKK